MRIHQKFRNAFRGLSVIFKDPKTYLFHLLSALIALVAGILLDFGLAKLSLIIIISSLVIGSELINDSIEHLGARISDGEGNDKIRNALDISAGAVLLFSISAVIVGLLLFLPPLLEYFHG